MKIGIAGVGKSQNIGDQLIAKSLGNTLLSEFVIESVIYYDFHAGIYDVEFVHQNISSTELRLNKEKKKKSYYLRFIKSLLKSLINTKTRDVKFFIKNSDVILIGGGHLLIDNYGDFIINTIKVIKEAKKQNKKIIFFSVGVGDKFSLAWKILAKYYFSDIDIYTRDSESYKKLIILGLKPKYTLLDPAFQCKQINSNNEYQNKKNDNKIIHLFIMDPYEMQRHCDTSVSRENASQWWMSLINDICDNTNFSKIVICNNGSLQDYYFIESYIKKSLKENPNQKVEILERCLNYNNLLNNVKSADFIIAQRLHAIIPSISYLKPFLAIRWDMKLENILKDINLESNLITYENKSKEITTLINNYKEYSYSKLNNKNKKYLNILGKIINESIFYE